MSVKWLSVNMVWGILQPLAQGQVHLAFSLQGQICWRRCALLVPGEAKDQARMCELLCFMHSIVPPCR